MYYRSKLRNWIDPMQLVAHRLYSNKNAINYFKERYNKVNWFMLSFNPDACDIIENNQDKINWSNLSKNKNAVYILKNNLDKVDWCLLSLNFKESSG